MRKFTYPQNLATLMLLLLVVGCGGPIKETARVSISKNTQQIAGVGDTVLTVEIEESLPNIVGEADVFGRTRPKGRVILTYLGLDGVNAGFKRTDIDIVSNATTLNSGGFSSNVSTTTFNGYSSSGNYVSGSATTYGGTTIIPSNNEAKVAGNREQIINVPLTNGRGRIIVSGQTVEIINADPSSVTYLIR